MEEQPLSLDFSASGNQFYRDVNFDKAVLFLSCINSITKESFKTALNEQYNKNKDIYGIEPEIRVNKLGISSVAGTIYTIVPPMLGLLAPHINTTTWSYLKNSFELIKAVTTCFFSNNTKLPTIAVNEKLEGSQVVLAERDSKVIINNYNIVLNAKKLVAPVGQLASLVKDETVNTIQLTQKTNSLEDSITIQKETSKYYDARELYAGGSSTDEFYCKVYRLNVKQRTGSLTIFESLDNMELSKNTTFTVSAADLNDFVEALKYDYSYATGMIVFRETLFGDKEIESVTLHTIDNVGPKQI